MLVFDEGSWDVRRNREVNEFVVVVPRNCDATIQFSRPVCGDDGIMCLECIEEMLLLFYSTVFYCYIQLHVLSSLHT